MLRNELIEYCAPTLAGIKTGNMFTITDYPCDVIDQIRELNRILTPKGLRLIPIKKTEKIMILYGKGVGNKREGELMLLTIFLTIVFCVAITLMMFSAVAFIQDKKFFSSAPKEAQDIIIPREKELFYGARIIGWTLMIFSILMILGVGVISIWDGFRSGFTFIQFFMRFVLILTVYKIYDMICFDYFLLMKFKFFQFYFPEVDSVYSGRKYGYNIKSQLLKLIIIFPAVSAFAAWICVL